MCLECHLSKAVVEASVEVNDGEPARGEGLDREHERRV